MNFIYRLDEKTFESLLELNLGSRVITDKYGIYWDEFIPENFPILHYNSRNIFFTSLLNGEAISPKQDYHRCSYSSESTLNVRSVIGDIFEGIIFQEKPTQILLNVNGDEYSLNPEKYKSLSQKEDSYKIFLDGFYLPVREFPFNTVTIKVFPENLNMTVITGFFNARKRCYSPGKRSFYSTYQDWNFIIESGFLTVRVPH